MIEEVDPFELGLTSFYLWAPPPSTRGYGGMGHECEGVPGLGYVHITMLVAGTLRGHLAGTFDRHDWISLIEMVTLVILAVGCSHAPLITSRGRSIGTSSRGGT